MPKKKTAKRDSTAVEAIRHTDKRKNIPTEELRDFVTDEEQAPKTLHYPRDPSLDPQLVWKGKDDQDQKDLAVPVVPIYIQEKIHPQAIIDDFQRWATDFADQRRSEENNLRSSASSADQLSLFADFNGLPEEFDQRIDFYQHDAHWSNRFILGDSLLVMTSLAEKEGLRGKVQTIYIDPPYGIRFGSNWQVSTRKRDVKDGRAEDATRQPEQVRAFRDTWKLGIHSYLAYLRDRLVAARELLTETGSVFVQIGDENVHLVRSVMDEVFGSANFVSQIAFKKTSAQTAERLPGTLDYLLWYAKSTEHVKYRQMYRLKEVGGLAGGKYQFRDLNLDAYERVSDESLDSLTDEEKNRLFAIDTLVSQRPPGDFPVMFQGKSYRPKKGYWKTGEDGFKKLIQAHRILLGGSVLMYKRYFGDFPCLPMVNVWEDTSSGASISDPKVYVVQTQTKVIQRCLLMTTDPGDLVLDPTCGSGTTAYVAEQWGRRWITCDTSRVALALARTRLMAAKFPYYHLADDYPQLGPHATDEEIKKALRTQYSVPSTKYAVPSTEYAVPNPSGRQPIADSRQPPPPDIRRGFVYRRVPHVTLKSIANNPDIREGMTRAEIDAAIARHAETETLFDQPYEDKKRVRVSGPFTVESLSPHRTISVEEKKQRSEAGKGGFKMRLIGPDDFATMIIDNLRKAGVQNTVKNQRLTFGDLKPYAGEWIHAEGWYTEYPVPSTEYGVAGGAASGKPGVGTAYSVPGTEYGVPAAADQPASPQSPVPSPHRRRAAICIGPEHGTVGAQLVKEAAKEAVKGVGFDMLIVCGFAFDPSVSEETKRYGKLTVLPTRMNPDLAMGDELLKKTSAGNLFMVFGEPDIEIRRVGPQMTQISADKNKKNSKGKNKDSVLRTSVLSTENLRPSAKSAAKEPAEDMIVVEIKGLDVYDPTTGEIRGSSTDDIACWFIDIEYNSESFFVRHAYFTGADEPYEKLKRALRAEIDEAAWSSLYSTTSLPFPRPESGKIAVKVINHYGDEVMKVYDV